MELQCIVHLMAAAKRIQKPLEWKLQIENRVGLLAFALTGFGKMSTELILAARYRGRKP